MWSTICEDIAHVFALALARGAKTCAPSSPPHGHTAAEPNATRREGLTRWQTQSESTEGITVCVRQTSQ